jgi:ribosomal protein S18 acetylase RimI-like enzyme
VKAGPEAGGACCALLPLGAGDFAAALALWEAAEGVKLRDEDRQPAAFERFLRRNPGLSWAAWRGGRLVGAVMAGHDGRRGHLYHLAVAAEARGQGVGRGLVERVLRELAALGIPKVQACVLCANTGGQSFWQALGWSGRDDLRLFSRSLG